MPASEALVLFNRGKASAGSISFSVVSGVAGAGADDGSLDGDDEAHVDVRMYHWGAFHEFERTRVCLMRRDDGAHALGFFVRVCCLAAFFIRR